MKKVLSTILGLVCLFALVLGCAENPDGSMNFAWTITCLSICAGSGWAWSKLNKEGHRNA